MKWWPGEMKTGDMVRVRIGSIRHYGVYLSDDEVVQFGLPPRIGTPKSEVITVCSTTMEEFAGDSIAEKAKLSFTERLKRLPPRRTAAIARSRIGEGGYDLLHNNCEHFAFECVFGVHRSEQEEAARKQWNEYVRIKAAKKQ